MADAIYTLRDRSDEYSAVSFPIAEPAGDGSDYAASLASLAAIQAAIGALSLCTIARKAIRVQQSTVDDTRPTSAYAQRELGLRLFWQETGGNFVKGYLTIAGPDLALIETPGSDEVDLVGVTAVNTLVAALEAFMQSPNGEGVEFYKGVIVGRRN
jgi:hypothetical protein